LAALIMIGGIVAAGTLSLRATSRHVETTFRAEAQTLDVARAGIIDAYAWFRRQPSQPVSVFAPQRDLSAVPPINETDDASIGLVREFELSPGYWARYEVRTYDDLNGNGAFDTGEGAFDFTAARSLVGVGTVWHIESRGYVYRQIDPDVAWNVAPNYRVAGAHAASEVRRMSIVPPGEAPLCCDVGSTAETASGSRIVADGMTAIVYAESTGTASTTGSEITASQTQAALPDYDASWSAVFGATPGDLREMATIRLAGSDPFPSPLPDLPFVFVDGNLTISSAAPLQGTGLIVVDGDLTLGQGNNSYFTGIIYVTGNYTQLAPSLIRGVVIVRGAARIEGLTDVSELVFDPDVTNLINAKIGPYRLSRGLRRIDSTEVGGELEGGGR
jgi:hypothetical protein